MTGTDTLTPSIRQREDRFTSGAYAKRPLTLVRGQGCTVWDDEGNAYLDLASGIGVAVLGHGHPALLGAIQAQAAALITCPELLYNDRRADIYETLNGLLPGGDWRFFLGNSGAEAVEGALKAARLLTGRTGIVAARRAFHGRTLGALALTWKDGYRAPFAGWMPDDRVTHVTYGDLDSAATAITGDTAAVVVEPVQGEGGVYPASADYLRGLRELCDTHGALLIADEIQTGLGRTGRWFAVEHAGVIPDAFALGKGLAGGVPMGVVAWRAGLGPIPAGTHGSTFGGNPLACAAAVATVEALRAAGVPGRCAELGAWFQDALRALDHPQVREVRGLGLMVGMELRGRVGPVLAALGARGLIALPAGRTVLRFLPPLVITRDELARAAALTGEALDAVR